MADNQPYKSAELLPPKGDQGIGSEIIKMLDEILKYREDLKFAERCVRFYKLRRNEHWKNKHTELKLISANMLGSHHQKTVNMLTDNNPTFNAVQGGELDENGEDGLSLMVKTIDSWWIDTEQQHEYEESVHVGELYGTVGRFLSYSPDINFPEGEVEVETLDPMYYSMYPPKCRKMGKAEGFLRWYPMTVREARRKWPESAEFITGDMSLLSDIGDDRNDKQTLNGTNARKQTVLNSVTRWFTGDQSSSGEDDSDDLFVIEAWVKDYSVDKAGEPVYPGNIRRVRCCNAGDVVLDDVYNPSLNSELPPDIHVKNYLFSRFPATHTQSVTDPASPMGMADMEQLEQLNIEVNKTLSQFTMFKDKSSRVKLVNPKDSGVSNEELDNRPGIIRPTNHLVAQAIQYINPPQMGTDMSAALSLYKDFFNEVAGSFNDVMQGQKSGSEVIAAKAIAMLLEEASRMQRGKTRNYSKMLRETGRMYIALAQNWYDTPRYVKFQKNGTDQTQPVDRNSLQIPGKINIVTGSTMPVSAIQRREEVLTLAQGGYVDQEYVLDTFDIDNFHDIITRMQQGPLGQYLGKLGMVGVPQPILDMFQKIGQMDEKMVEKAMKDGTMPNFMQIVQQLLQGQQQQPEQPDPEMLKAQSEAQNNAQKLQIETQKVQIDGQKAQAEIQKIMTSAAKEQAEIELIKQRIESEITDRQIRVEGLGLDKENIKIQKAQAVANIQNLQKGQVDREKSQKIQTIKTASDLAERDHNEREGIKSRQHSEKEDTENRKERMAIKMRDDKGGYDERGMTSNNQEPT